MWFFKYLIIKCINIWKNMYVIENPYSPNDQCMLLQSQAMNKRFIQSAREIVHFNERKFSDIVSDSRF